ncbi:MAG: DAK2 domain-containing protein [Clostridia bacterium]|nr:DAK2 domain-containing protein [Clostridia bacterium]
MIMSGANNLCNHKKLVDELNVFPVPDGDTGTNMALTIMAVKRELSGVDYDTCSEVASYAATASLRGARGNSGVILSQFFRGYAKALENVDEITVDIAKNMLNSAQKHAYRAVMKPQEGTILTVAREMYEGVSDFEGDDVCEFLKKAVEAGNASLERTPELLPALKSAGVVDSGGKGLMLLMEGALYYLENGEIIETDEEEAVTVKKEAVIDTSDIKFGYCTEFLIKKEKDIKSNWKALRKKLECIGDCVLVINDKEFIKVHVHSNQPGTVLNEAMKHGSLLNIKIDNMREQSEHTSFGEEEKSASKKKDKEQPKPLAPYTENAFITVANGEGIVQLFGELGVSGIISGGQTMNPSTDDFINEIEKLNAGTIFVFPNNKNIIMAAQQASEMSGKNIIVIPTKSIVQGISALMAFDEEMSAKENEDAMLSAVAAVKSGSVTFAARDCEIEGLEIHKDDIMGLVEGKIKSVGTDKNLICQEVIAKMLDDGTSEISLFTGEGVSEAEAEEIEEALTEKYPDITVNVYPGGQALYYYYISVE